jgi:YVTN family beta-propeller protein
LGDPRGRIFPAGLAMAPDGRTLYAALNLENAVAVVEPATGTVRARVRLASSARSDDIGPLPYALVLVGQKLYVSEWNGGGVTVIDTREETLLHHIPTGGHASGVALSPDGSRLYVGNATSDTVSVIDTGMDAVVGAVDLTPCPGVPLGSLPNAVAVSPDGRTLYVANGGNNDVAVVDTGSLAISGLIPTAWFPSALWVSPDGRWVALCGEHEGPGGRAEPAGSEPRAARRVGAPRC